MNLKEAIINAVIVLISPVLIPLVLIYQHLEEKIQKERAEYWDRKVEE